MRTLVTVVPMIVLAGIFAFTQSNDHAQTRLRVAFVISENFNMIDFAGPWEVFQDAAFPPNSGHRWEEGDPAFELYTVSDSLNQVHSTGGLQVTPAYTFAKAPRPDVIVIGAQSSNSEELISWLKENNAAGTIIMSVCTGARKLALAGLIDGRPATTHHDYLEGFRKDFPKVKWQGPAHRFVQATDTLYSSGGLTSGIDLALHIVAKRIGPEAAAGTATYMEYKGEGWKGE